jgi:methionyl-tRNA formyltransferase
MIASTIDPIRIGYFGDGPWAHRALEQLHSDPSVQISFVCGRFEQTDVTLKAIAEDYGLDFLTHPKINSDEFINISSRYNCDLFVSMSFNQIFREPLYSRPPLGTINCHAGKLPFYRGRNVLNWALINGESEFGITVHYIDDGIDTGDILTQNVYPISDEDDYGTVLARAHAECGTLLYDTVKRLQRGGVSRIPQDSISQFGTYCTMRVAGDETIDWLQCSRDVFNFVRAVCRPGPEARTWRREAELKINRVQYLPNAPVYKGIPGAVLRVDADGFLVKTGDSYVKVTEWTSIGKIRAGDRLSGRSERVD